LREALLAEPIERVGLQFVDSIGRPVSFEENRRQQRQRGRRAPQEAPYIDRIELSEGEGFVGFLQDLSAEQVDPELEALVTDLITDWSKRACCDVGYEQAQNLDQHDEFLAYAPDISLACNNLGLGETDAGQRVADIAAYRDLCLQEYARLAHVGALEEPEASSNLQLSNDWALNGPIEFWENSILVPLEALGSNPHPDAQELFRRGLAMAQRHLDLVKQTGPIYSRPRLSWSQEEISDRQDEGEQDSKGRQRYAAQFDGIQTRLETLAQGIEY